MGMIKKLSTLGTTIAISAAGSLAMLTLVVGQPFDVDSSPWDVLDDDRPWRFQ